MRIFKILFICILFAGILQAQNIITSDSPIVGTWDLISPKKSPGPEFVPESYKGMTHFTINVGQKDSEAFGSPQGSSTEYPYSLHFNAEWDGKKLTGLVTQASWTTDISQLKVSVPLEYDEKKKQIIIHINNPEYGNVKFIFKHNK